MKNRIFPNYLKQLLIFQLKSPLYYLISILYILLSAINFYIKCQFFTSTGSTDFLLYFSVIPYLCTIAIPALCYKNSNYCYEDFIPLKKFQKNLAYFLSILILYTIIIFVSLFCLIPVSFFGNFDFGKLVTGFICLIFFGAAIISICIFINELISSKIASLVVSILILLIFNCAHLVGVYLPINNTFAEFLKKISFAWHFDAAGKGIIDTRDIFWLLGVCALFLILTAFVEERKAENHNKVFILKYAGLCLISVLVMLNGNRYFKRLDFSDNKTYSISKYTKTLLKQINDPVKITYYRSSSLNKLYPQVRDVSDFISIYSQQNKNISYIIKDPDKDSSLKNLLEDYGITSQQMKTVKNNSTEYINVYSAIVVENQGNYEVIPFSLTADSLEYDLDGRIKHLLFGQTRTVNVILGNGMDYVEDYSYLVPWLSSQGFIVNPIFIQDPNFEEILNKASGLLYIIGDLEIDIKNAIAIENYILNEKGNALFNVSPFSVDIEGDWNITKNKRTNIIEMLENWGIYFPDKVTGDISCSTITMYSHDESENPFEQSSTYAKVVNYPMWVNALPQTNSKLGATFFWASPIEILSDNVKPYIVSSSMAYSYEFDSSSKNKLLETNPFVLETVSTSNYEKSQKNLAVEINGKLTGLYNLLETDKEQIIVISDQYFVNSLMTGYNSMNSGDYRNFDLVTNILLKLNGEEELGDLQSRTTVDTSLYKISDMTVFIKTQLFTYVFVFLLLPVLIVILNLLFLFILKRNRK